MRPTASAATPSCWSARARWPTTCRASTASRRWWSPATRATAAAIHLRAGGASRRCRVVGVEPALKPARGRQPHRRIGGAGHARARSKARKFRALRDAARGAGRALHACVPCDGLAGAIEAGDDAAHRRAVRRATCGAAGRFGTGPGEIDTLVLGCTHYPFVADRLRRHAGDEVRFIETGVPVARQTRRLLAAAAGPLARRPWRRRARARRCGSGVAPMRPKPVPARAR